MSKLTENELLEALKEAMKNPDKVDVQPLKECLEKFPTGKVLRDILDLLTAQRDKCAEVARYDKILIKIVNNAIVEQNATIDKQSILNAKLF